MSDSVKQVALRFNAAINAGDLAALAALMTDEHRFIDSSGGVEQGKAAMKDSWVRFFKAYPDYQNVFESVTVQGDLVAMRGYSTCSNEPALEGPAIWTARIEGGLVSEWRVLDDNPANRAQFGL